MRKIEDAAIDFTVDFVTTSKEFFEEKLKFRLDGSLFHLGLNNAAIDQSLNISRNNTSMGTLPENLQGFAPLFGKIENSMGNLNLPTSYDKVGEFTDKEVNGKAIEKRSRAPEPLRSKIHAVANTWKIDPIAFEVLVAIESYYKMLKPNSDGYSGYTQVSYEDDEAKGYNIDDPDQNLVVGAKQLANKLKVHKGDYILAMAAYNAGNGTIRKYKGIPPWAETQNYVRRFVYNYKRFISGEAK